MAATVTAVTATENAILYRIEEDATPAAVVQVDILTDLGTLTQQENFAGVLDPATPLVDQAEARAVTYPNFSFQSYNAEAAFAGDQLQIDANVSAPSVAANYRLEFLAVKSAPANTPIFHVWVVLRHTLTA